MEIFTEKNESFEDFNEHEPTTHFDLCGKEQLRHSDKYLCVLQQGSLLWLADIC